MIPPVSDLRLEGNALIQKVNLQEEENFCSGFSLGSQGCF